MYTSSKYIIYVLKYMYYVNNIFKYRKKVNGKRKITPFTAQGIRGITPPLMVPVAPCLLEVSSTGVFLRIIQHIDNQQCYAFHSIFDWLAHLLERVAHCTCVLICYIAFHMLILPTVSYYWTRPSPWCI